MVNALTAPSLSLRAIDCASTEPVKRLGVEAERVMDLSACINYVSAMTTSHVSYEYSMSRR